MKLLGKKKKKEEEEDEEEEEKPKKKKKRRKRRKKKTHPKPWGRKERIIVGFLFAGTILASAFLSMSARSWKLPRMPKISLSQVRIPFFGEEKIIIEGNKTNIDSSEKVIKEFKNITNELSGVYGLYVIRLDEEESYGVEEDTIFQAASLIKLPVIAGMYIEEENGNISLDDEYTLKEADKLGGSGSLSGEEEGYILTYRELVRLMGQESDNTAFNIARNLLSEERVEEIIDDMGMENTSLTENETTPIDIGEFFRQLWRGDVVGPGSRDELLSLLTDTVYEKHLAAGVPEEVRVAHKYGRETRVVNDAGIVFADEPYVVVILSKGVVESEADEIFSELSRFIYEAELNK